MQTRPSVIRGQKEADFLVENLYIEKIPYMVFRIWEKDIDGFLELLRKIPLLDDHRYKVYMGICYYLNNCCPDLYTWLAQYVERRPELMKEIAPNHVTYLEP